MAGHGKSQRCSSPVALIAALTLALCGCQTARPTQTSWNAPTTQPSQSISAPATTPEEEPVQQVSATRIIPPEVPPAPPVETVELPPVEPTEPLVGLSYGSDLWTQQPEIRPSHGQVMKDDLRSFLPTLRDDAVAVYTDPHNLTVLGVSLGVAIGIRQDADGQVREYTARHPGRWGRANDWIEPLGNTGLQLPVLFGLYGYSVYAEDDEDLELARTLIRAYALTGLSTVVIKGVANTDRPSEEFMDGQWGFPSGHSSTSFAIAAVLDEYYGHQVGVPAYVLAGLVGWSRIDNREHDVSDVVFGSALGYVIGKTVARRVYDPDARFRALPYSHPTDGTPGIQLYWEY